MVKARAKFSSTIIYFVGVLLGTLCENQVYPICQRYIKIWNIGDCAVYLPLQI